ncbi:helix-turn-helix domain-containing protein [Micromonospora sp. DR5-3]|uniref:helix-turn-helix domain-containing protein n=1 Tax=unclassified Micromonospora TaxID=2617518 RepID=UPI0011D6D7F7|nr:MULTISPECIES: helix-turn-helix transcriptional regulator [unclassified Micromonospora]MCW3816605.1 helix-turn-helix domain-containing protein [Micromonospora sp. DR5-3]TYC23048.1 helix-turn-helix domain-containing protein [Micromonospora sp. MP36]
MTDPVTFGARLRAHRERAGKTRPVLGGLVGRSAEWVKALENGRLLPPRLPMLLRLAEVLDISDLADLTGDQSLPVASVTRAGHPDVDNVAAAMQRAAVPVGEPTPVDVLRGLVDQAWALWHRSTVERTAVAAVLPGLLADAQRSARRLDGLARRQALVELARVYHLAQLYLAHQPYPELVWLAADRAMLAAQDADDPAAIAVAAWYYAHVYRGANQVDAAEQVLVDAAGLVDPAAGAEQLARWGQAQLGIALGHSKAGRAGKAWRAWNAAEKAASRLGDGYAHPWLMFGPAACAAYAVTIETDLCRPGEAVRRADTTDFRALPSHTRRAAALIEAARAHMLNRGEVAAMHLLGRALRDSVDTVRHQPFARTVALELSSRPGTVGEDARELALAIGVMG